MSDQNLKTFGSVPVYVFILTFFLSIPVQAFADAGYWISKAEEQFRQGDKKGALESFQRASWERPQDPILHYNMGVISESLGRLDEAVDHYLSYMRWDPQATDRERVKRRVFLLCGKLGSLAYRNHRPLDAVDWYLEAKRLYPKSKGVHFNLGKVYEETGDLKQAETSYKRYWELSKGKDKEVAATWIAELLRREAEACFHGGQFKEALAAFGKGREWNHGDPRLLLGQARCEDRLGMLEKACEHYWELLRVDPKNPNRDQVSKDLDRIYLSLAEQYLNKNDFTQAEAFLLKGIQVNPQNVRFHYLLAQIYQKTGRGEQALSSLEAVLRLNPEEDAESYTKEYVTLCMVLANKAFQEKDPVRALHFLKKARSHAPGEPLVAYNLAEIYDQKKEWKKALEEYRRYLSLAPNTPDRNEVKDRMAYLYYVSGADFYEKGAYADAQEAFEQALLIRPQDPSLLYNIALVLEKRGEIGAAIHFLERYLQYEKDPAEVRKVQRQMAELLKNTGEAARYAKKPVSPDTPPVSGVPSDQEAEELGFRRRAYLLLQSGRWEDAISMYEQHVRRFPTDRNDESLQEEISLAFRELSRSALLEGRYSKALASLKKARQWSPSEPDSYLWQGNVYESLRRPEEALKIYEESLRVVQDPEDRTALFRKITGLLTRRLNTALRQKDYLQALHVLSTLEPYLNVQQKKDLHYQRARIQQAMGHTSEALVEYGFHFLNAPKTLNSRRLVEEISSQVKGNEEVLSALENGDKAYALGTEAAKKGDYQRALFCFLVAKSKQASFKDLDSKLLESVRALKMTVDPMEVLSSGSDEHPRFFSEEEKRDWVRQTKIKLGEYFETGLYEEGLKLVERMQAVDPQGEFVLMKGLFEEMLGKDDDAIEQYERALLSDSSIPRAMSRSASSKLCNLLVQKAIREYKQRNYKGSLQLLKQAENLEPFRKDIAFNLGCVYLRERDPNNALAAFSSYLSLIQEDSPRKKLTANAVDILKRQIARTPAVRYDQRGVKVDLVFEKPFSLGQLLSADHETGGQMEREKDILDSVLLAPYLERPMHEQGHQSLSMISRNG